MVKVLNEGYRDGTDEDKKEGTLNREGIKKNLNKLKKK